MKKLFAVFLLLAVQLWAFKDLYVSQSGTTPFNGLEATPFRASDFNNATNWGVGAGKISPGDHVHLLGTFTSQLICQASGTSTSIRTVLVGDGLLTMGAAPSWSGTTVVPGIDPGSGLSHIVITRCEITQPTGTPSYQAVTLHGNSDIVVTGNYIHNTYRSGVFDVSGGTPSSNCIVRRNWFDDIGGNGGGASDSSGGVIAFYGDSHLVEYNIITKSMDRTRPYGIKIIIRNNYWGLTDPSYYPNSDPFPNHIDGMQTFDFPGQPTQTQLLYERNWDVDNGTSSDKNGHSFIAQANNGYYRISKIIARHNVLARPSGADTILAGIDDYYGYNNTGANIGPTYTPGTNNAVFFQTPASARPHLMNNTWDFSLGLNSGSGIIGILAGGTPTSTSYDYLHAFNQSGTQPALPSGAHNLAQTTPGFTDGTGASGHDNYTLTAGALLRGVGGAQTTASGAGASSFTLTMADALWFTDGWGVAEGDWVTIGNGAKVQIFTIVGNVATLVEARTWSDGDAVRLVGTVDFGALPYGATLAPVFTSGTVTNLNGTATVTVGDAFNVRFVELLVDGVPTATQFTPSGNVYTLTWSGDGLTHTFHVVVYAAWASQTPAVVNAITYSAGVTSMRSARFPNKAISVTIP